MAGKAASAIVCGSTTITTAGTRVQLVGEVKSPNLNRNAIGIIVSADSGNTEPIVIGQSTVKAKATEQNGVVLAKGTSFFIECSDVQALWVDAGTSGDKASWMALYR